MPEACFLCLDSTEFMRNGDQFPNRMLAEQETASLLVNAKVQANAENTVGFLTTGGNACTVFETLTNDVDRVMASITGVPISGKRCHFSHGLLIASLALSHRTNPRAEKRIVAFIGSPLQETEKELDSLAKKLRKDDVAVDVVTFGVAENIPLLESFVAKVNRNERSRFLSVLADDNLTDAVMRSAILLGEGAMMDGMGGGDGAGGDVGFGVDPNLDPELALAIRMSIEEEERRQAAVAAAAAAATTTATAPASGAEAPPQPPATAAPPAPAGATANEEASEDEEDADMDEVLRRALAVSLEESRQQQQEQRGAGDSSSGAAVGSHAPAEEADEEFVKELEEALAKQDEESRKGSKK